MLGLNPSLGQSLLQPDLETEFRGASVMTPGSSHVANEPLAMIPSKQELTDIIYNIL